MQSSLTTQSASDHVTLFIVGVDLFFIALIAALILFFVIKYHHSRGKKPVQIKGSLKLEILWTVIPSIIVMAMFYMGWKGYIVGRRTPSGAFTIETIARKWSWSFVYPNGKSFDTLYVPANTDIALKIRSEDVVHSFYAPDFRVKMDAMPGRENKLWFHSGGEGHHNIFCAEYCGTLHSQMRTAVRVISRPEFDVWMADIPKITKGDSIYRHVCKSCHSIDGSQGVGPTFKGLWGRQSAVITEGTERQITVDAAYIRQSVSDPGADLKKGYQNVMPAQKFSEEELEAVIDFLRPEEAE